MTFKETVDSLKQFVDSFDGKIFFGISRDKFIKIIYELERQFLFMETSDKKPDVSGELLQDIMYSFDIIQSNYVVRIITKKDYNFVKAFLLFIDNWNCNVPNDKDIKTRVVFLSNLYDNHMTVVDSFNILKALINRCEKLERFALPSVELARHYLNALDREIEK